MEEQARLIEKVQDRMQDEDIDVLAVTKGDNLEYLTGVHEIGGVMVLEQDDWQLYVSRFFRYTLEDWPNASIYDDREELGELLEQSPLDDDDHIDDADRVSKYDLEESNVVEEARLIKEEFEIERIRRACEIGDKAFEKVVDEFEPGMTEWELVGMIDSVFREEGVYNSFDTLAHINTLEPHRELTDEEAEEGDLVLVDLGCFYEGYASDMTRMVPNDVSGDRKELLEDVAEIQEAALDRVEAGMEIGELCDYVKELVEDRGYSVEEQYLHSLGHGVGVVVHEGPRMTSGNDRELEENMVITVEPGLYVPGVGGVRIEDTVVVKQNGYERLTETEKVSER